jgi:hypothetical protein
MKKTLWIAMVGALVASVVAASAQEVLSANAVGYIKKTLPAEGKLVAMSIPLDSMTEADIVFGRTSVANEAPPGTWVYFWDETAQIWSGGAKSAAGGGRWAAAQSNHVCLPGEGFFMKGALTNAGPVDITITGEVPADASLARALPGGLRLGTVANPFPVDFKFGESTLALDAAPGTWVYFWDETAQIWSGGAKSAAGGGRWAAAQSNRVVLAGESFFMKDIGTNTVWTNARPYTWPNND